MADSATDDSASQQTKAEPRHKDTPDRPPRPSRNMAEGQTEDQTKDVEMGTGDLTEDDPDTTLRGEDQLSDGAGELAPTVQEPEGAPEAGKSFEENLPEATEAAGATEDE